MGGKDVAITRLGIGMDRFKKLVRAVTAAVIILMVGAAAAAEIEFKINPNKLPPCPKPDLSKNFDVGVGGRTEKWNNCWGKYKALDDSKGRGDVLEGEWRNGLLSGYAIYISFDGSKYFGNYRDGMLNGLGVLNFISGDKYHGELKDGKKHGTGEYNFSDGRKYVGEYREDKKNGFGIMFRDGAIGYSGNWKDNEWDGFGKLIMINDQKYEGEFKKGKLHGKGIFTKENGAKLEGVWENDELIRKEKINIYSLMLEQQQRESEQLKDIQRINLQVSQSQPTSDGSFGIVIETNADTASLKINGEEQGGRADGKYSVKRVARAGGDTQFTIVATDTNGNTDTKTIIVSRPVTESKPLVAALNPAQVKQQPSKDAVAIIIGIADYKNLPRADFANDDARVFYDYAVRALGVKPENIKLLVDTEADDVAIYRAFKTWLPSRVRASTDVYVYYSGHGLPTADGQGLYLLPQRADRDFIDKTAITQAEINAAIQAAKPKSVTVFLDSCYSGQARSGETLIASARPVALKTAKQLFPDNFTVITASQADQISSSSPDLKHGIFSYYLMRGMEGDADANKDGKITAGEMQAYLLEQVTRQAGMQNRVQQPQLIGDVNQVLVGR